MGIIQIPLKLPQFDHALPQLLLHLKDGCLLILDTGQLLLEPSALQLLGELLKMERNVNKA
jgi:hypothetical protein